MLRFPTGRLVRTLGQAAVLTALVGGSVAYSSFDKTVELTVDGQTTEVRAFARTVDAVLQREGIVVGDRDLVAPAPGSSIEDGDEIVVRYGRQLTVTVDGEQETYWTTALTVDDALGELGIRADGAVLSASRSARIGRQGLDVEVAYPKDVQVVVDGSTQAVETEATTVGELLAELDVTLSELDIVSLPARSDLEDGLVVTVTRVESEQVSEPEAVAFTSEVRRTDDLVQGERKVATKGVAGERTNVYDVVRADGTEVYRKLVSDAVTTAPVTEVILVGTKERPAPEPEPRRASAPEPARQSSESSRKSSRPAPAPASAPAPARAPAVSGGSVWDRLAKCESGGNWSINTGNGYYGGLQFSLGTWRAYGGTGMPHQNSREQQIAVASRVRDARGGYGDWPACSRKLGL